MRRRRRPPALLALLAVGALIGGCGSEDRANDPRPPATIELGARVDDRKVQVSPTKVKGEPIGAGLVNFTVSNQTAEPVELRLSGPTERITDPVPGRGVLQFLFELEEGLYLVETGDPSIRSAEFEVGPERPSAQNDLLLP